MYPHALFELGNGDMVFVRLIRLFNQSIDYPQRVLIDFIDDFLGFRLDKSINHDGGNGNRQS